MKILMLHRELLQPGGSETLFNAISQELLKCRHKLTIFTKKIGPYAEKSGLVDYSTSSFDTIITSSFDLVICMHRPMVPFAIQYECPKIFISNGVIPIELGLPGFDKYISISEEVQVANKKLGLESDILYNGINFNEFQSFKPVHKHLKRVLMISNHYPGVVHTVREAALLAGAKFTHVGGPRWTIDTVKWINDSDLVVSLGRGAYEAMACERNVVIFDYRGGDGFVTPKTLPVFREQNCSGRTGRYLYNAKKLSIEFCKYDPDIGFHLRTAISINHDIKDFVYKLVRPYVPKNQKEILP